MLVFIDLLFKILDHKTVLFIKRFFAIKFINLTLNL